MGLPPKSPASPFEAILAEASAKLGGLRTKTIQIDGTDRTGKRFGYLLSQSGARLSLEVRTDDLVYAIRCDGKRAVFLDYRRRLYDVAPVLADGRLSGASGVPGPVVDIPHLVARTFPEASAMRVNKDERITAPTDDYWAVDGLAPIPKGAGGSAGMNASMIVMMDSKAGWLRDVGIYRGKDRQVLGDDTVRAEIGLTAVATADPDARYTFDLARLKGWKRSGEARVVPTFGRAFGA